LQLVARDGDQIQPLDCDGEPSTLGVHLSDLLIQLRDLPFARLGLHGVGLEGREVAITAVDGLGALSVAGVEYRF
jgi:hypothetical protein